MASVRLFSLTHIATGWFMVAGNLPKERNYFVIQLGGWVSHNIPAHKVWVRNRFGEYIPGITASKPPHFMTEQERKAPLDMKKISRWMLELFRKKWQLKSSVFVSGNR